MKFNIKPAVNCIVRDSLVFKSMIYPNFLHPLISYLTAVNKGSVQQFEDRVFADSPSR